MPGRVKLKINQFENLLMQDRTKVLILGDFYLNSINICDNNKNNVLLEFLNFKQINMIKNFRDRCLDLVITNIEVSQINKPINQLVTEDPYHPALVFQLYFKDKYKPSISK